MSHPHERDKANPHPSSSHRTPSEIAEDESGEIGANGHPRGKPIRAENGPVKKVNEPAEKKEPK